MSSTPLRRSVSRSLMDWCKLSRAALAASALCRAGIYDTVRLVNQSIMEKAIFLEMTEPAGQHSLFVETARLSEGFYAQLQRHPVPLEDAAIRAINNNSMALDIYAWLACRLHALAVARSISWNALKLQFGGGFARRDHFKEQFLVNLRLALAVYPDAKVDVEEGGLILHSSRPPVSPRPLASIQARR